MADVTVSGVTINFIEEHDLVKPKIALTSVNVILAEDPLALPAVIVSGVNVQTNEIEPLSNPVVRVSGVAANMVDTEFVQDNVFVKSVTAIIDTPYDSSLFNNVFIKSLNTIMENDTVVATSSVNIDSFGYFASEYIPPPIVDSPDLDLLAKKRMRYFEKYTMEEVAMHVMATIGSNGVMSEFTIDDSIINEITLSPGSYMHNGIIAEIHDPITFSAIGVPAEPYYVTGKISLTAASPKEYISTIIITDDPTDKVILATKSSAWTASNTINLAELWKAYSDHILSGEHASSIEKSGINNAGTATNPYVCRTTGNQYDYDNAHFSYSLMVAMIESLNNGAVFQYSNSVADNIFDNKKIKPYGINGTFVNIPGNVNIGPLGITSYGPDPLEIDLGELGTVSEISSHIVFGCKSLSFDTTAEARFSVATNNADGFYIVDKERGAFISAMTLIPNENGEYELKAIMKVPSVESKEGSWLIGQSLTNEVHQAVSVRVNEQVIVISGKNSAGQSVSAQSISPSGDVVSVLSLEIDSSKAICHKTDFSNKFIVAGGISSSMTIVNDAYLIDESTMSGYTVNFSYGYFGASSVSFCDRAFFGVGENTAAELSDSWKVLNVDTMTTREAYNRFPVKTSGLISSRTHHMSSKSIHVNGDGGFIFDSSTETFSVISVIPAIGKSSSNPALVSARNRVMATNDGLMFEFNAETETFITKPNPLDVSYNSTFEMSSEGTMVSCGGNDESLTVLDSVNYFREAFYAVEGWAIEWQ